MRKEFPSNYQQTYYYNRAALLYSEKETEDSAYALAVIAAITFVYTMGLLIFGLAKEKLRKQSDLHFLFYFLFAQAGTLVTFVLDYQHESEERINCVVQGFLHYFFSLSLHFWTMAICYTMWLNMLKGQKVQEIFTENFTSVTLLLCFLLPLFLAILPLLTDSYGPTGLTCYIQQSSEVQTSDGLEAAVGWIFVQFFFTYVSFFFSVLVIFKLRRLFTKHSNSQINDSKALEYQMVVPFINFGLFFFYRTGAQFDKKPELGYQQFSLGLIVFLPFITNTLIALIFHRLIQAKSQGFKGEGIKVGGPDRDIEEEEQKKQGDIEMQKYSKVNEGPGLPLESEKDEKANSSHGMAQEMAQAALDLEEKPEKQNEVRDDLPKSLSHLDAQTAFGSHVEGDQRPKSSTRPRSKVEEVSEVLDEPNSDD